MSKVRYLDYVNPMANDHIFIQGEIPDPKIVRAIFNGPATIVFWNDGTKTVVKCANSEHYNKRVAIMWCIMKKLFGSTSSINKQLDILIDQSDEIHHEAE